MMWFRRCVGILIIVFAFILFSSYFRRETFLMRAIGEKKIYIWTPYFGKYEYWPKIFKRLSERTCPESDCQISWGKSSSAAYAADAVLFHLLDLNVSFKYPTSRRSDQVWVLFVLEPPTSISSNKKLNAKSLKGVFNWTMSYKRNADVYVPYGKITPKTAYQISSGDDLLKKDIIPDDIWSSKKNNNFAVWISSHCQSNSRREILVHQIGKYVPVDIYGACGKLKCGNRLVMSKINLSSDFECNKVFSSYYFYFAFENSLCKDYVTEKFYRALQIGVIPVVLGGANYSDIAPRHSYIDALEFSSPKELASYLKKVSLDNYLYNRYFKWHRRFDVFTGHPIAPLICDICLKLHENSSGSAKEIKSLDVWQWFVEESNCTSWRQKMRNR